MTNRDFNNGSSKDISSKDISGGISNEISKDISGGISNEISKDISGGISNEKISEDIIRRRMHGLYLSRNCTNIATLSKKLLGLHSWFHRNVCFSALIRGVDIAGWKTALTKTWLYRGTLHGVAEEDLPQLLALNTGTSYMKEIFGSAFVTEVADEVLRYMEDGVYSRAEFRKIFAQTYDARTVEHLFSPWGGIFMYLARLGKVAFRDMTSRDFDLISAEPRQTPDEVLPGLMRRYITAYGPATLADAAWFFGLSLNDNLRKLPMDDYDQFEHNGKKYYYIDAPDRGSSQDRVDMEDIEDIADMGEIPEITLLSGFDPYIVSYADRSIVLPAEHKHKIILKSGICLPTVAIRGCVAGVWNIKKNEPVLEFFEAQPQRVVSIAMAMVDSLCYQMKRA